MAFYSGSDLIRICQTAFGAEFNPASIRQAAYELCLGNEVYRTDSKDGKLELLDDKNKTVEINAGQFALVLTKETIDVPLETICFISIKASEKLKGLINVSGFHVDPGFKGKILFSVYNAGPSTITLKKDEAYFLIWFSDLTKPLSKEFSYNLTSNSHQNQQSIPMRYVDALKRGELASPSSLVNKIEEVENELKNQIKDVERKKLHNQYLLTVLIGAVITLLVKIYWDSKGTEFGYNKRVEEERVLRSIDSAKGNILDSNFYKKLQKAVDSAIKGSQKK